MPEVYALEYLDSLRLHATFKLTAEASARNEEWVFTEQEIRECEGLLYDEAHKKSAIALAEYIALRQS